MGAASVALPAFGQTEPNDISTTEIEREVSQTVRHNASSFRALDWEPYFSNLKNGAVLVDISSRALHFWSEDGKTYKLYPSSVPLSEELTRRGRTKVTRKVVGPSWRPTPSMLERNPEWPEYIPPGPDNPLGTHALYLSWQYYRITAPMTREKLVADHPTDALAFIMNTSKIIRINKSRHTSVVNMTLYMIFCSYIY